VSSLAPQADDIGVVPIEEYGLLGDTRTAALVAPDGSLDWMCVPTFDGEPVFGRLVGGAASGRFVVGPPGPAPVLFRRYRADTATLETTWAVGSSRLTLTEGMVAEIAGRLLPSSMLVRRLTVEGADVDALVELDPRLGDRRRRPTVTRRGDAVVCAWRGLALSLQGDSSTRLEVGVPTVVRVTQDRPLTLVLGVAHREPLVLVEPEAAWAALHADEHRWRSWCAPIDATLPCRSTVVRSLLTLRLLTYAPSGAPVAAPTTSLPEVLGGVRNWDYRFAWPRDASIGIAAFLGAGKPEQARHFMAWLLHATRLDRPRLPVLLTIRGGRTPRERELPHWPGYVGSRPVRAGNGAAHQHQLDGYGWVVDAAWRLTAAGHRLYDETWRAIASFADAVASQWREPDAGIWEIRGPAAHHVHSKLMAWLALDRALRIASTRRTPARRRARWATERAALGAEIVERGFSDELDSFTRTYGSADVDAALVVLPTVALEPLDFGRVEGTIARIASDLTARGPLLYRYRPGEDGLPGREGAFLPCSFWMVTALAQTGRLAEAKERFDELVALASPLGLFAEEIDPVTGRHLGNFPQALTHAGLVEAALALRPPSPSLSSPGVRRPGPQPDAAEPL
jgi:GH15 family glucan-1,4-alpha-glucosidase